MAPPIGGMYTGFHLFQPKLCQMILLNAAYTAVRKCWCEVAVHAWYLSLGRHQRTFSLYYIIIHVAVNRGSRWNLESLSVDAFFEGSLNFLTWNVLTAGYTETQSMLPLYISSSLRGSNPSAALAMQKPTRRNISPS